MYAPSKWEVTLQCNVISLWLDTHTKWSLHNPHVFCQHWSVQEITPLRLLSGSIQVRCWYIEFVQGKKIDLWNVSPVSGIQTQWSLRCPGADHQQTQYWPHHYTFFLQISLAIHDLEQCFIDEMLVCLAFFFFFFGGGGGGSKWQTRSLWDENIEIWGELDWISLHSPQIQMRMLCC